MLRTRASRAAALAVALVGVVSGAAVPGSAAAAEPVVITDASDDVTGLPYLDVQSARVSNSASKIQITYRSESYGNRRGEEKVWLDTNPRRPGPELEVGFGRYSEGWTTPLRNWKRDKSASARRKWSPNYSRVGTCDRTVRLNSRWEQGFTPITLTIRKKKGCITAKAVRIHVGTSTDAYDTLDGYRSWPDSATDEFPNGRRTFTDWVTGARSFTEGPDRVHWWNDLRSVTAELTDSTLDVTIQTNVKFPGEYGAFYTYLDTNEDSVPDYRVLIVDAGGGSYLAGMNSWDDDTAEDMSCWLDGHMTTHWDSIARFSLATDCIGDPATLRVAVRSEDFQYLGHDPVDWLGGVQTWSDPIG
ncbi:hypothetical protein [Nocardioides sp.]|uniref:hypothetical protein n=1 Tax=Nocardioides sp. TaxID=35761 RepID=UPI002EDB48DA